MNSPSCFNTEHVSLSAGNRTHSANGFFSFSTNWIVLQSRSGICINKNQFITLRTLILWTEPRLMMWHMKEPIWNKPLKLVLWNHLDQIWLIWNRSSVNLGFFWKENWLLSTTSQSQQAPHSSCWEFQCGHSQMLPVLLLPWTADDVMCGVLLKIIFL